MNSVHFLVSRNRKPVRYEVHLSDWTITSFSGYVCELKLNSANDFLKAFHALTSNYNYNNYGENALQVHIKWYELLWNMMTPCVHCTASAHQLLRLHCDNNINEVHKCITCELVLMCHNYMMCMLPVTHETSIQFHLKRHKHIIFDAQICIFTM